MGFGHLQRSRLHNRSGLLISVVCNSQNKELFPHVHIGHPMFQFAPIVLYSATKHCCLDLGEEEKILGENKEIVLLKFIQYRCCRQDSCSRK